MSDQHRCDNLAEAQQLIYEYQSRKLEERYADVEGIDDVRSLFFGLVYPEPEMRGKLKKRNDAFARLAKNKILHFLLSKPVVQVLEEASELERATEKYNAQMAENLCARGPLPEQLEDELHFELMREICTYKQNMRRIECALNGFKLGIIVILHFPWNLKQIIKYVPRRLVGDDDLFDLAIEIYNIMYNHRNNLESYMKLIEERETSWLKKMYEVD